MKRRLITYLLILLLLIYSPAAFASAADGSSYVYDGFTYDYWGNVVDSPAAFEIMTMINIDNMNGMKLQSVDDVCTSKDGRIFLVDKLESRVNVFDSTGTLIKSIKAIMNEDNKIVLDEAGNQVVLNSPSGAYYHDRKDELYIADTEAKRIVVLDGQTFTMKKIINEPANMTGVTEFKPSKITVDQADRIYVVVQSSYEGIIELNKDGSFSRYFGVNVPRVNLVDFFWKSLASDTQKQKMGKTYAPAFNNVTMDSEGFVYAVTYDSSAEHMIFRLNSAGENVLREMGNFSVMGSIYSYEDTKFVDVAVTDYGVYAGIDSTMGRIYLYNFDGELLNVFGCIGNLKGQFKTPTSIAWNGYNLIVTDSELKCAYIYTPTEYGEVLLKASEAYYNGEWEEATQLFEEVLRHNSNIEVAYVGIGKNYLMQDEYELAMYYFEQGNSRDFYSKAYKGYRTVQIEQNFGVIAAVFITLVTLLVISEVRYQKKGGKKV